MAYVSLHTHSNYSLLDGEAKIPDLVKRAKELGMKALAITDHGNMFGAVKFYNECKKQDIKPIIGCEVYTAERSMLDKDASIDRKTGHLILLCKNKTGYENLIKIVSNAYIDGFYYKPRTDKEQLKKYHEGIICLSGCLAGKTQKLLSENRYDDAKKEALELKEIFGEDFYLELQDHHLPEDRIVIPQEIKLSKEIEVPVAATNDSHYILKEDADAQDVLLCIQTQSLLSEPNRMRFANDEFYLKSEEEMRTLFSYIPEAIDNTQKIADLCSFDFEFGHYHVPKFEIPAPYSSEYEYFRYLCEKGFKERYGEGTKEQRERFEYEIKTIKDMGYTGYFLIVWDFINHAKNAGIPTGKGRGSASGSCVSYTLGITDIDPFKYNLVFERFLSPERVSMPDIDVDFCIRKRPDMIKYVAEKYGRECVSQIATFTTMKAKRVVRDVAKVMGMPYSDADALAKMIPEGPKVKLRNVLDTDDDFRKAYENDSEVKKVIDMSLKLEDTPRDVSSHASGIVIASDDISKYVPMCVTKKGIATEFDMTEIESLGILKFDFLGLRNLTVIDDTIKMIKRNHRMDINLSSIDMSDQKVYENLSSGNTVGVFQLEAQGITEFFKDLKPTCFEDIIAGVSLYRPGPMDFIPEYLENKKHPDKIKYLDEKLKPILDVTYGCMVYQEQVMQIVRDLAGYSFGRADLVRRAMAKKKMDVMLKEKEYFVNGKLDDKGNIEIPGCIRNGVPKEAAEKIFDSMVSFAEYAFNKSHAAAYSVITYETAWLKTYYPSEFMACLMTDTDDNEHIDIFIKDAKKQIIPGTGRKIDVLPPHVLYSNPGFEALKSGNILFGLASIKGVGEDAAKCISEIDREGYRKNRGNIDPVSYFEAIPEEVRNKRVIESLIKSGAMRDIFKNVHTGLINYPDILKQLKKDSGLSGQMSLFETNSELKNLVKYDTYDEYDKTELLSMEKEYLGTYISGHPLSDYEDLKKKNERYSISEVKSRKYDGTQTITFGLLTEVKTIFTKKGDKMAFCSISSEENEDTEVVVFPKTYLECESVLKENTVVVVSGDIKEGKILAGRVFEASDYRDQAGSK